MSGYVVFNGSKYSYSKSKPKRFDHYYTVTKIIEPRPVLVRASEKVIEKKSPNSGKLCFINEKVEKLDKSMVKPGIKIYMLGKREDVKRKSVYLDSAYKQDLFLVRIAKGRFVICKQKEVEDKYSKKEIYHLDKRFSTSAGKTKSAYDPTVNEDVFYIQKSEGKESIKVSSLFEVADGEVDAKTFYGLGERVRIVYNI